MTSYPSERFSPLSPPGTRWACTRNTYIFVCGYCGGLDYADKCGRCGSTDVKVFKLVKP